MHDLYNFYCNHPRCESVDYRIVLSAYCYNNNERSRAYWDSNIDVVDITGRQVLWAYTVSKLTRMQGLQSKVTFFKVLQTRVLGFLKCKK